MDIKVGEINIVKKELSTSELQHIEFRILQYIKNICESNHIQYYLVGGTALGAIRHQGFIPWDDDVDIAMLRDDYEHFCSVMEKDSSDYKLLSINNNKKYSLPLAKVIDTNTVLYQLYQKDICELGVYVDIFILDNVPQERESQNKLVKGQIVLNRLWNAAQNKDHSEDNIFKAVFKAVGRRILWIIGPRFFAKLLDKRAQKYRYSDTNMCGSLTYSTILGKSIYPKSFFSAGKKVLFENDEFIAPLLVEEYLKNDYGDYMQLPPIEKRISHHDFVAYYKK